MTQIWPFKPRDELIEALEWRTDVFQAKASEQRIALREAPRRVFTMDHKLAEYEYSAAMAMMREAQVFYVPDWAQSTRVGNISSGSSVNITNDLSYVDMGDTAVLWESLSKFEQVTITIDSNGTTLSDVVNDYSDARLIPLWLAHCPDGLSATRAAGANIDVSVSMAVYENTDLSLSTYSQYRSLDVIPSCPVVAGGSFDESLSWGLTAFDNAQSIPTYIRQRNYADVVFQMRWHELTPAGIYGLRQWLHSRRGRQKAFWLSSRGHDFEPADDISGTTVTIFALDGISGLGRSVFFDIDITTYDDVSYYRRVSLAVPGTPVGGRSTIDMTIDSMITLSLGSIKRISVLHCARFESDRIELLHRASIGTVVQVPCVEIPEP